MMQPPHPARLPILHQEKGPPVVDSSALLGTGREIVIIHGDDRYRLLLTAQNKLLLTK